MTDSLAGLRADVTRGDVLRAIQEYDRLLEGYQRVVTDDRSDDVRDGPGRTPWHLVLADRNRGKEPHGDLGSRDPR